MLFRLIAGLALIMSLLTACQDTPPAMVVLIITSTPAVEVSPSAWSQTDEPTLIPTTPTVAPTATPNPFPTPTTGSIQVAEQLFEHGRMFWIQPKREIWVAVVTAEGSGTWMVYPDTFQDGEPEADPNIIPPGENLYQPERGFGKLWRENTLVRDSLGWAITPQEFGYVSRYEYHAGGTVDANNTYIAAPGYHIIFSLYEEAFRFNEINMTWQLGRGE